MFRTENKSLYGGTKENDRKILFRNIFEEIFPSKLLFKTAETCLKLKKVY